MPKHVAGLPHVCMLLYATEMQLLKTSVAEDFSCWRLQLLRTSAAEDFSCRGLQLLKTSVAEDFSCWRLQLRRTSVAEDFSCWRLQLLKTHCDSACTQKYLAPTVGLLGLSRKLSDCRKLRSALYNLKLPKRKENNKSHNPPSSSVGLRVFLPGNLSVLSGETVIL